MACRARSTYPIDACTKVWTVRRRAGQQRPGIPVYKAESRSIAPDTLEALPSGGVDEIAPRGPRPFPHFRSNPGAAAVACIELDGARFFQTGDLGYSDKAGCFFRRIHPSARSMRQASRFGKRRSNRYSILTRSSGVRCHIGTHGMVTRSRRLSCSTRAPNSNRSPRKHCLGAKSCGCP